MKRNPNDLTPHPLHDEFGYPDPLDDVLRARLDEIGLSDLDPIDITEVGEILDGRGRCKWAIEQGIKLVPVRILELDEDQVAEHVIRCNSSNKTISKSARINEARRIEEIDVRRSGERRSEAMRGNSNPAKNSGVKFDTDVQNPGKTTDFKKSREKAAEHAGLSEGSYHKAKKAQERAEKSGDPENLNAVNGAIDEGNISKAERISKGEPEKPSKKPAKSQEQRHAETRARNGRMPFDAAIPEELRAKMIRSFDAVGEPLGFDARGWDRMVRPYYDRINAAFNELVEKIEEHQKIYTEAGNE